MSLYVSGTGACSHLESWECVALFRPTVSLKICLSGSGQVYATKLTTFTFQEQLKEKYGTPNLSKPCWKAVILCCCCYFNNQSGN